jgi:probable rRNA maturation factor
VRRAIRAAAKPYGLPADARITVAFVGDLEMRALNKRYRRKDRTTDVLSFGQRVGRVKGAKAVGKLERDADGALEVGDVVISPAQAGRQANRRGHAVGHEIAFLAAHGALHLLGFEDESPAGYREMVRLGTAATAKAPASSGR